MRYKNEIGEKDGRESKQRLRNHASIRRATSFKTNWIEVVSMEDHCLTVLSYLLDKVV